MFSTRIMNIKTKISGFFERLKNEIYIKPMKIMKNKEKA